MLVLQVLVCLPERVEDPLIHKQGQHNWQQTEHLLQHLGSACAARDGLTPVPGSSEEELRERPKAALIITTCTPAPWELGACSTLLLRCILNAVQRKLIRGYVLCSQDRENASAVHIPDQIGLSSAERQHKGGKKNKKKA